MIYDNILDTIGNTPVVKLTASRRARHDLRQDRGVQSAVVGQGPACVRDHRRRGAARDVKPGQTVVEATSGNTGIALAMVCAARGYPFVATMVGDVLRRAPQDHARARRESDPDAGRRARHGHGAARGRSSPRSTAGFSRASSRIPANPAYHRQTTGPEILQDFAGRRLDFWVTGWGTGGTLTGAGEMIKLARPEVQIIATEPAAPRCSAARPGRRTRSRAGRRTSCPTC